MMVHSPLLSDIPVLFAVSLICVQQRDYTLFLMPDFLFVIYTTYMWIILYIAFTYCS